LKSILISLAALAAATPALAGTIDYSSFSVTGDVLYIDTPVYAEVNAGVFHLTTTEGSVDAWCVDVFDDMQGSGSYKVVTTNPAFTKTQIGQIGALVDHGAAFVKAGGPDVSDEAAAIQMAIWNVAFGSTFSGGPTVLYGDYLADATNGTWSPDYAIRFLSPVGGGRSNQTLAMAAPEPSTWALLGLGFAGIAFPAFNRKRQTRYAF
jgi:hypothetical protein